MLNPCFLRHGLRGLYSPVASYLSKHRTLKKKKTDEGHQVWEYLPDEWPLAVLAWQSADKLFIVSDQRGSDRRNKS